MFFKSLKKEILAFTLGLTVVIIVITTALSVYSTQTAGSDAENATSNILREQAKEFLTQITQSAADRQDFLFERIRNDAGNLAVYVQNIYENPSVFSDAGYWKFDDRVFQKNGRYLNRESDISTVLIPRFVAVDAEEKRNVELTANLDFIVPSILESDQNTVAIYTIDTKGAARYFPNIILGDILPPEYDPREDVFYKPATPKENREKKVVWSGLYDDPAGQGLMITASAPIYTKNGFEGVVGIDVLLNSIIKNITVYSPIEGSYAFLIDKEGQTIALPDKAYLDILGRSRKEGEVRTNLASSSEEFSPILKEMMNGATGFGSMQNEGKELFIAYAPLKQTGFSMAIAAEEAVMLKAASTLKSEILGSIQNTIVNKILPASLFIIFLASVVSVYLVSRITKPIQELTRGAREIGSGNLDYNLDLRAKNEIGDLASSFNQMSRALKKSRQELYQYSQGLEAKIKERTQNLTDANEHLREMDRMKSEFVSIASHQLRAPLTAVKGYASMLVEGSYGPLQEKMREPIGRIMQSAENLIAIIEDFLNLSRIEQGKLSYQFARIDILKLAQEVFREFKPRAEEKGLALFFSSNCKGGCFAMADEGKMRQIISNLVDNSIKYTPRGEVQIHLSRMDMEGSVKILLSVSDTGIGIAPGDISRLFQRFSRGSREGARKLYTEGTGLGLYVAKAMMEAHRGRIWAESEGSGKGAKFCIELSAEK